MSAAYSNQGAVFLAETGFRSAALAGVYVAETFAAGLTVDFAGDLTTSVSLGGALTITSKTYVDLVGDISFTTDFAGSLSAIVGFAGDLAPNVTLSGNFSTTVGFTGDLPTAISFDGSLTVSTVSYVDLSGNLVPAISFGGDLTVSAATVSTNRAAALMIGV